MVVSHRPVRDRATKGTGSVSWQQSGWHDAGSGVPDGGPFEWVQRGLELLDGGDAGPAAVLLEHAATREPESSSICEALSRAYYDVGHYEQAAAGFQRLLALIPTSDYGHFGLGLALTRLDRFELAGEHLAMAVAMRPDRREYVDRLRQVRATLDARRAARGDGPS